MKNIFISGVALILSLICFQVFAFDIRFTPVEHAAFVIELDKTTIYVDPVGNVKLFKKFPNPDIILITDTHHDHLDKKTINSLRQKDTAIIGPEAVIKELGVGQVIKNSESRTVNGISIESIPMYNLTRERLKFHPKGRGNGYILTINGKRIYISGDTEDIPEMRKLKDIEHAFICMNLPYTMSVEQAASAVLDFKPRFVYPYHYRGENGISNIEKFKKLVEKNKNIKVKFLKWYK